MITDEALPSSGRAGEGHALPPHHRPNGGPCQLCHARTGHRLGCRACACDVALCAEARTIHHRTEENPDGQ